MQALYVPLSTVPYLEMISNFAAPVGKTLLLNFASVSNHNQTLSAHICCHLLHYWKKEWIGKSGEVGEGRLRESLLEKRVGREEW
jgi:hypothetical protein